MSTKGRWIKYYFISLLLSAFLQSANLSFPYIHLYNYEYSRIMTYAFWDLQKGCTCTDGAVFLPLQSSRGRSMSAPLDMITGDLEAFKPTLKAVMD